MTRHSGYKAKDAYQMFKEIKSMAEFFNYEASYKHVWPNKDCLECFIQKDEDKRIKINWAIPTPTCAWYEESREHPSYSLLDRACDNCRGKK